MRVFAAKQMLPSCHTSATGINLYVDTGVHLSTCQQAAKPFQDQVSRQSLAYQPGLVRERRDAGQAADALPRAQVRQRLVAALRTQLNAEPGGSCGHPKTCQGIRSYGSGHTLGPY